MWRGELKSGSHKMERDSGSLLLLTVQCQAEPWDQQSAGLRSDSESLLFHSSISTHSVQMETRRERKAYEHGFTTIVWE